MLGFFGVVVGMKNMHTNSVSKIKKMKNLLNSFMLNTSLKKFFAPETWFIIMHKLLDVKGRYNLVFELLQVKAFELVL